MIILASNVANPTPEGIPNRRKQHIFTTSSPTYNKPPHTTKSTASSKPP